MLISLLIAASTAFAATKTSTVMIEVQPDGSRAFAFAGACADVTGAHVPLAKYEIVDSRKVAFQTPSPKDTVHKNGSKKCLYTCPKGTGAVALTDAAATENTMLVCVGIEQ